MMRILYIAKHGSGGNDDEGSIAFALGKLGHEVVKVQEFGDRLPLEDLKRMDQEFSFCLFHKWSNFDFIKRLKCPKAFWYFDLVDWPQDPTLSSRCEARKRWMAEVTPLVDLGFCTDGDWVERDQSGKLLVLRQGADERVVGFGEPWKGYTPIDVLFIGGIKGCGVQRESFVRELQARYGHRFTHFSSGVYGRALANAVATSKVVVCPDSPVTDRYWSNRVYVMGGFGACLLHPYCSYLSSNYSSCLPGVYFYRDREDMYRQLDLLLSEEGINDRKPASEIVLEQVKQNHLYRHRCEELVRVVKERLKI